MSENEVKEVVEIEDVETTDVPQKIEEKAGALDKVVQWVIEDSYKSVTSYVKKLEEQNPGISRDDLAKKIVSKKSIQNGFLGAATGLGGVLTLPVTIPADLIGSWKIQITMVLAIATVYGHTKETADLKTDIFIVLAGDSAKEALKRFGIEVGKGAAKKAIDKTVTREVMKKIHKVISRKIITKAGEKSSYSFAKMVPLIGAPIGFAFDWFGAQAVGKVAISYYRG